MVVRLCLFVLLGFVGGAIVLNALIVLGWLRHGASPYDLSFLHIDWVLHPELPYWQAHMVNLTVACVGLVMIVAAAWNVAVTVSRFLSRSA